MQAGEEENEIVADLLPGGGQDDHRHRLGIVQLVVPQNADGFQPVRHQADLRMQQQHPQHGGNGGGDGVGPDEQGAVDRPTADFPVCEYGEQQRHPHRQRGNGGAKPDRTHGTVEIERIGKQIGEIIQADKLGANAKRVLPLQAGPHGATGGPEEEEHGEQQLRCYQQNR